MTITSTQIVLYISFISCIILISYYYKNNNHNEPFNTEAKISLEEEKLDNELEKNNIKDIETKTKMIKYFTEFQSMLNHADDMDAPITINNNGNACEPWGDTYADGKSKNYNNNCINAILIYSPFSICLKYAARGSLSIVVFISSFRGNGCIITRFCLALVRISWVRYKFFSIYSKTRIIK